MKLQTRVLPLLLAASALVGCDQGRQTLAQTTVRIVNVAPSFAELAYRREQTSLTPLPFKTGAEFTYDADRYDFFAESRSLLDDVEGQVHTWQLQLNADLLYTFVITENAGLLDHIVIEHPRPTATQAQIVGLHAATGLPAMDVYLAAPGIGIGGATPIDSLDVREVLAAQNIAGGEYELWLTEAGNPSNVLFASTTLTFPAATSSALVITPEGGQGTAPLSVVLLQASAAVLYDRNATAGLRVINGAADGVARDFAINNQFTPPLFSAAPYATATSYATVPAANAQPIQVTPVGNPGVFELNQTFATTNARLSTLLFAGPTGTLTHQVAADDRRRIANEAKLQFFNAANQFTGLIEFVVVPTGTDPNTVFALAAIPTPGISLQNPVGPGTYDLSLRRSGTNTIIAGPVSITLESGGIYSALAVNGPDTATATLVLFDDFL